MRIRFQSDDAAIGLSTLCILHCLAIPILLMVFPSLAWLSVDDEAFHLALLWLVVPISLIALSLGYRHHKNLQVLLICLAGLGILVSVGFIDHEKLGHYGEVGLTVLGSVIIAIGHYQNARLRRLVKTAAGRDSLA